MPSSELFSHEFRGVAWCCEELSTSALAVAL